MFDLDHLIARVGPDYIIPEIIPNMVCTECGGELKTALAMTPPAAGGETPSMDGLIAVEQTAKPVRTGHYSAYRKDRLAGGGSLDDPK